MKLLLVVTLFTLPFSTTAQQDSIDAFIAEQMKEQNIMGLSIGVIKNGKVIMAKGYGLANIELKVPATAQTEYKIASVSKQFIAVAIMKLVQDGKLKVTDPVSKYITNTPSSWKSITIRHLLDHTSGLPSEPPAFDGMKEVADSVYIKAAFTDTLSYATGTKYEYSNFGYFVLADIIRIVSGTTFPDYMKKNIFDAADLMNTRTTSASAIIPDRASGYMKNAGNEIINAPDYIALRPSGAFLSNINDLLKWELVMQNNKVLTKNNWSRMWSDTTKTPFTMDDQPIYYGYGWMTN